MAFRLLSSEEKRGHLGGPHPARLLPLRRRWLVYVCLARSRLPRCARARPCFVGASERNRTVVNPDVPVLAALYVRSRSQPYSRSSGRPRRAAHEDYPCHCVHECTIRSNRWYPNREGALCIRIHTTYTCWCAACNRTPPPPPRSHIAQ